VSINTTSTSDRIATDSTTSSSAQEEGAQKYGGVSAAMAALPDPAVIARLANEFFAALPTEMTPPNLALSPASPSEAGAIPAAAAPPAAVPDFPREMFSFPAVPNASSVPGVPQPPSSPPAGPLTEADFPAIVASLSGAAPLVPQVSAAAPAIPGPFSSVDGEKGGPWAAAPQIPPAAEMYSFPGVPAMPLSPPTAPPSGADLAAVPSTPAVAGISAGGGRTDPWASAPTFLDQTKYSLSPAYPARRFPPFQK
jgi:cysteine desulfurase/selenocysteine lyase